MSENFMDALREGVKPSTLQQLSYNNLDKAFSIQTKEYYKLLTDMVKNSSLSFTDRLSEILNDGIDSEQIIDYFKENVDSMGSEKLNFAVKAIDRTKGYEKHINLQTQAGNQYVLRDNH